MTVPCRAALNHPAARAAISNLVPIISVFARDTQRHKEAITELMTVTAYKRYFCGFRLRCDCWRWIFNHSWYYCNITDRGFWRRRYPYSIWAVQAEHTIGTISDLLRAQFLIVLASVHGKPRLRVNQEMLPLLRSLEVLRVISQLNWCRIELRKQILLLIIPFVERQPDVVTFSKNMTVN